MTTVGSHSDGTILGEKIVEQRLAACVQILPKMTSIYFWEGKLQNDQEHLLLIKTLPEKYGAVEKFILDNHSYETPEIVAIPVEDVSSGYLNWLKDSIYNSAPEPS